MDIIIPRPISQHLEEEAVSGQRSIDASVLQQPLSLVLLKAEEDVEMLIRRRKGSLPSVVYSTE